MKAACIVLLCCGLATAACDRIGVSVHFERKDSGPQASPTPEPPWLVVNEQAIQEKPDRQIFYQGPKPPRPIRTPPVQMAVPQDQVPHGVWLVYLALSEKGEVLKAQLMKGPPGIEIDGPLVEALRGWRFHPAVLKDKPVAVYFARTFDVVGTGP